ncbi:integrating conjugative element protein [Xenorhabdus thuongxuanensis]|uniref:Integrating conjugative element protein n=1 Tax=Xenorhabdus thuongxuanensis TaxID=1873484 RepID=A0A1Q5TLV2_9GAMM|nr:integrating conjugative element protein [Xenorhabdus thuongxuanensis]
MTKINGLLLVLSGLATASVQGNTPVVSLSLPQVNNSVLGYGADVSGAVSDTLFYTLGGGSVISQPATRRSLTTLGGLELGWSSDLMCGNFDLKTIYGHRLNASGQPIFLF